jgi:hypothetical protein
MQQEATGIKHVLQWSSSTGQNDDLKGFGVREEVRWTPAPKAFGPWEDPAYGKIGQHNGLNPKGIPAELCENVDVHLTVPTGFKLSAIGLVDGQRSDDWTMTQHYQVHRQGMQWENIPGADYTITRWLERQGSNLIVHIKKQSLTEEVQRQRVWAENEVKLENWQWK